jgi:polyhydroxyalkanoate synthesis repressor PhaR
MQTIKKYANRKLYHTNRKQYITLEGIAALIQAGDQVQVLDNETGEDITAQILTQVVLQTRGGGRLPTQVLTGLIQAGGDTIAGVRRSFWSAIGGTGVVDAEIKRRLDQLHDAGRIDTAELARLHDLLLHSQTDSPHAEGGEMPSHRDIAHLRDQVEALTAVVDQLLAERGKRAETRDVRRET